MFENEQEIVTLRIQQLLDQNNIPETVLQWKWIPFAGHWGMSTSFFQVAAKEVKMGSVPIFIRIWLQKRKLHAFCLTMIIHKMYYQETVKPVFTKFLCVNFNT